MKIYWKLLGAHYHCRVFFNGKSGDLVCGFDEWREFRTSFTHNVTWIDESNEKD